MVPLRDHPALKLAVPPSGPGGEWSAVRQALAQDVGFCWFLSCVGELPVVLWFGTYRKFVLSACTWVGIGEQGGWQPCGVSGRDDTGRVARTYTAGAPSASVLQGTHETITEGWSVGTKEGCVIIRAAETPRGSTDARLAGNPRADFRSLRRPGTAARFNADMLNM